VTRRSGVSISTLSRISSASPRRGVSGVRGRWSGSRWFRHGVPLLLR